MNQRHLASVLFAAAGVFIAASHLTGIVVQLGALIPSTPDGMGPSAPDDQRPILVFVLISSFLAVLMGSALVLLRDNLSNRLFPPANHLFPPANQSLSAPEVQAVALSVLGCYFVVQGLAFLAWAEHINWSSATQVVLGIGLFLGARSVSRLWSFGRSAGTSRSAGDGAG